MNLNLAAPWNDVCSKPFTADLMFYSPAREDLLFATGPTIDLICQAGRRSIGLRWTLARNTFVKPFLTGTAQAEPTNRFRIQIDTAKLQPGFYDLRVTLETGTAEPVAGICTFGYRVAEFPIRDTRPADFRAFWEAAKAKLDALPLDAREEARETFAAKRINEYNVAHACLPADYDPTGHVSETVESGKVNFAGPDGGRVYGWLAKPPGPGRFPAMLVLPGAGFAARPRPLEHARHGYLALDIQVHGQEVDLARYDKLPGYDNSPTYEPPRAFYFYNIQLRVLQAIRHLASRPDVDADRIVVVGGSQGGRLALVTAALDPRIQAVVACIAHFSNQPYLAWAERSNQSPHALSDGMDVAGPPPVVDDARHRCLAYYDPMNYAPDVRCPVLMNGGLIDPVSPPASVWAAYQRIASKDKAIIPLPGLGHDWSAEFDRYAWRWLAERLGTPTP